MTTIVNIKKTDKYNVYIGRGSIWGNPFKIDPDNTRKEVIEKYRECVLDSPELMKKLPELKDKVLGCFCKPLPCHGDILIKLLEEICSQHPRK